MANIHEEDLSTVRSWFSSPVYNRYWQHYQQAMAWHQKHRRAYSRALQAAYCTAYCQGPVPVSRGRHQRYADWHAEEEEEEEEQSSSDDDIECDVSEMEISEELRQFFAQTEKHKEELKKQMEAEEQDSYVPADQDLHVVSSRSSEAPPIERPGERRRAEMTKLYGEDTAKIMAMEAAMQLTFNRKCDTKQPKYWPVIPLKL